MDIVTAEDIRLRRVAEAVGRAVAAGPDDDAHLHDDVLDALATGTIDAADREWADAHLATCPRCEEDLADRRAVQRAIDAIQTDRRVSTTAGSIPAPRRRAWVVGVPLGLGAAAAIVLAVVLQREPASAPAAGTAAGTAVPVPVPVDALTPEDRALVARVLAAGRVEVPEDIAFLEGRAGTLLGATEPDAPLTLEAPVATAVDRPRPEFRWSRVAEARSYTVRVFDEDFREVARAKLTTTAWVPDSDLRPGVVYAWQVTAHTPGGDVSAPEPPRPEARFRILHAADADAIARARVALGADRLTLGILEARAGLLDDAAASFRRARADAATSSQAAALLASLPGSR